MNREDIIRMAREAGIIHPEMVDKTLERFATIVASAEREKCAKVCEETTASWTQHLYNEGCIDCAKAIRARGQA